MNKPASTYVIIAHFTESGDFFPKKGGKHQGTFPSVSHRRRFLKRESLNNENTFPNSKNTNKKSSFSQGHSNVAELHCNLTGQNTKQNLRQKKWLEKFHISQVDKTRWHLNPGEGRNKDPVLMAGWQREREREMGKQWESKADGTGLWFSRWLSWLVSSVTSSRLIDMLPPPPPHPQVSLSLSRLSDAPPGHHSPTWPLWFQPAAAVYPISVTRRNCTWHLLFKEAKAITIARPDCSHH